MNFYLVVEGEQTEKAIYTAWISYVFSTMTQAERIEDLQGNHFIIFAYKGNPPTRTKLQTHVENVVTHSNIIDHFFIIADAEEESVTCRKQNIEQIVQSILGKRRIHYSIIVQNRCIETWLLGNRRIVKRNPQNELLRTYLTDYPVHLQDPETLPIPQEFINSPAAWHMIYLLAIFRENNMRYSKTNPRDALPKSYFNQLCDRVATTPHLPSLKRLLDQWHDLGGTLPGYPALPEPNLTAPPS
ncbi:MAG: hypothetical protein HQM03_02635 [Magnetococcales bacterium]|nr:hypothetical protein [Magnetococcales bacterium]